ncbi:uncharacterized protein EV154DRAFT_494889 [Mucor mucedo]|uniref:uncharacterized protein n=1 Tax=Mucor mucedo TaxID=29922 RepID=UPI0022211791|nr:uncharacterized protein EV154DRAFT_494889 [Mucor mucedo]KAI7895780.1 hypothetical protein EV154DRAFT_494889 [Mucor mucedo]
MHFCGTFICLVAIVLMVTSVSASINGDDDNGGGHVRLIFKRSDVSNGNAMRRRRMGVSARKRYVKNALAAEADIPTVFSGPVKRQESMDGDVDGDIDADIDANIDTDIDGVMDENNDESNDESNDEEESDENES